MKKIVSSLVLAAIMSMAYGQTASSQTLSEIDNKAKAGYEQARQNYINEMNAYRKAKQNFETAKSKVEKFKTVENKAAYRDSVQKFLSSSVSALTKYLEALRNKATNVRGISDSERTEILAYIDIDINWLKGKQTILSGALTDEQLKNEAAEIKNYWPNIKTTFKKGVADIWIARVNYLISKAESFSDRTESKIEELKAEGRDTSNLQAWLSELNANIETAKQEVTLAKQKRESISNVNFEQMIKEIHQFVKDANQYIRKSHNNLVKIIQEMKKMPNSSATPSSSN